MELDNPWPIGGHADPILLVRFLYELMGDEERFALQRRDLLEWEKKYWRIQKYYYREAMSRARIFLD